MKNPLSIVVFALFFSCNSNTEISTGDLYFKLVNLTSPNGMTEQQANKIEIMIDSIKLNNNQNSEEKKIIDYFIKLRKYDLLKSPYVKLKFGGQDIKTVFLNPKEHQKIKKYTLDYLKTNHTKLEVELKIKKLEDSVYYSDEIINMKEIKGETFYSK